MKSTVLVLAFLVSFLAPTSLLAQNQGPLSKTFHDPAFWLNVAGQGLATGTTTAFLTGHGQSVDHPGPCVEGNPHWGSPHPPLGTIWTNAAVMIGVGTVATYVSHLERTPRLVRIALKTFTYTAAGVSLADGARNVVHCGLY